MSFILDALRKSEAERQRNSAPGIADMRRAGGKKGRSIWLPLAALLAGLNIALLALLWYSNESNDPAAVAISPPPPTIALPPATVSALSDELAIGELSPAEPARYAAIAPPDVAPQTAPEDIEIPPVPATRMATMSEALLDGSLNIKPLHLDLHVYSNKAAERFVFINTARYGEGDLTSEGPTVRTINQEGVILSYQGRDFILTRD